MSANTDEIDEKILRLLQADARRAFVDIANDIGLSESAVRRRVKNLVEGAIIKRFTIELGASDKTSAITLISVASTADTSAVSTRLMELNGVKVVYEITGQYDIAAIIAAPAIVDINRCIDDIRKIDGVSDTDTVIILKTMR
jgi:DNA-binding Lrp family transcriptional regulator